MEALARKAGFTSKSIDMSTIKDVEMVVDSYSIFGRVTPEQKKGACLSFKKKK